MFSAWFEFKRDKENKLEVQKYALNLENNIFKLHHTLVSNSYKHSNYTSFFITDPKLRHIHKADISDRILHHAIVRVINNNFERSFIFDSYSSRKNKGTHKAVKRLRHFAWNLSKNHTKTVYALKCDICKFFDSIDHTVLLGLMKQKINDDKTLGLINKILQSYHTRLNRGLPLGNLTSQLFANVFMNPFDHFIKRKLKFRYYLRYTDDFILLNTDKDNLIKLTPIIREYLDKRLKLKLHPNKVSIRKWDQGVDFLGYVVFPHHTILRMKTKKRIIKKISYNLVKLKKGQIDQDRFNQSLQSYFGVLEHCRGNEIKKEIQKMISDSM